MSVVDALDSPGVQIRPGDAWHVGGNAFIVKNEVNRDTGSIRFVAARLAPAAALEGEVVLLTATFRPLSGDLDEAWRLDGADLVDKNGNAIGVRVEGSHLVPEIDWTDFSHRVFLPFAVKESLVR